VVFDQQLIGSVSLTDIQLNSQSAFWGVYLGEKPMPGIGSIVEYFFIEFTFNSYSITHLFCEVFEGNKGVIKLHSRFGFEVEELIKNYALISNLSVSAVRMCLEKTSWKNIFKCKIYNILSEKLK
jgi:RimJ/RimL family protein N-acetyltransferase